MPPLARRALDLVALVALLTLMDQLYRWLHPEVNLVRASLVGATAWASLRGLALAGLGPAPPAGAGGLAIFASAAGSVLLIQAGWLLSRSPLSVAVHVAILALAYAALAGRAESRTGVID